METINTLNFHEENSQEDTSFNVDEQYSENMEETTQEEETQEEEHCSEQESEEDCEEEEALDMEQVPLGIQKIVCERNGKMMEGEELVFTNPDTDLPAQTLEELDSKDLDDENDVSYNPESHNLESPSQEEDEACEDSDRESVDGEDLEGCMMKLGVNENMKLVWKKDGEEDTNEEMESKEEEEEEEEVEKEEAEYVENEDPDFNPVYCCETLSDCDEDVEGDEEPMPQVLNLAGDTCYMKCEDQMLIPVDTGIPVGPPACDMDDMDEE